MKHYTSSDFWDLYRQLPEQIQLLANKNYELLKANPRKFTSRIQSIFPLDVLLANRKENVPNYTNKLNPERK